MSVLDVKKYYFMKISLTFDNGPTRETTPLVLDTLRSHAIKATFFVLGRELAVPEQRDLTKRAFDEGHQIGNHSFNHATPFGLLENAEEAIDEIRNTDRLLGNLRGHTRLFRPFGRGVIGPHLLNRQAWDHLAAQKYTCVLWSVMSPEKALPQAWMEPALNACERAEWSVMVLHDIPITGAMNSLDRFLSMARDRGAEFLQTFPDHCVPMRDGKPTGAYGHLLPENGI